MPREYNIRQGPAAPNPMEFGSSNIELSTPTFRAQTNVDPGVNVFEQLQGIIASAAGVYRQSIMLETQEVQNNLTYAKAVEQQAEQKRIEGERKAEEVRTATIADVSTQRVLAEKEGNKEALIGVQEKIAKSLSSTDDPKLRIGLAQQLGQTTDARNKIEHDATQSKRRELSNLAYAYFANNNIDGLQSKLNDLLLRQEKGALEEHEDVAISLFSQLLYTARNREEAATKELTEAAAARVGEMVTGPVRDLVNRLSTPEVFRALGDKAVSPETVFDTITSEFKTQYPQLYDTVNKNPEEAAALIRILFKASQDVVSNHTQHQIGEQREAAFEKQMDSVSWALGRVEPEEGVARLTGASRDVIDTPGLSVGAKKKSLDKLSRAYVDAGATPADRANRALKMMTSLEEEVRSRGAVLYSEVLTNIDKEVGVLRLLNESADARGWGNNYRRDEINRFRGDIAERYGLPRDVTNEQLMSNPRLAQSFKVHLENFERDIEATEAITARQQRAKDAADPSKRRGISAAQVFDDTILGQELNKPDSPVWEMSQDELRVLVRDASIGYANSEVPNKLVDFIKSNLADPKTFNLQRAFWKEHTSATSPVIYNKLMSDRQLQHSFTASLAHNTELMRGTPESVANDRVQVMLQNLAAINPESIETDEQKKQFRETHKKLYEETIQRLRDNVGMIGNGTLWSSDHVDLSDGDIYIKLSSADQLVVSSAIAAALTYPDPANRGKMATEMLSNFGYVLYANDPKSPDLVYNPPFQRDPNSAPTTALPPYSVTQTDKWSGYMLSKAEEARVKLQNIPSVGGLPTSSVKINSVKLRISDSDIVNYGVVGITAVTEGGAVVEFPVDIMNVSYDEFKKWESDPLYRMNMTLPEGKAETGE